MRADEPIVPAEAGDARVSAESATEVGEDVASVEVTPPPVHSATRTRFVTIALNRAEHGIDGTFELWRDKRLDDKTNALNWFRAAEDMPPEGLEGLTTAQLVLRDEHGKIVESRDLEHPIAKLEEVRLGDDGTPYLAVGIDTYRGMGRWGGTTHRFARVEGGRTKWLECATTYKWALAGGHWFDRRPGGGYDILEYMQDMGGSTLTTTLRRIQVEAGACRVSSKRVSGWLGEYGEPPPPTTADFPARI